MKNIKLLLLAFISIITFYSCKDEAEAPQIPYFTFEKNSIDMGVEQGGQTSKDIVIYAANITSSDRTVNIKVIADDTTADPASYTVSPTVTIPAGTNEGILTVGLQDIGLTDDKVLTLRMEQTTDLLVGADLTLGLSQLCPNGGSKVTIGLGFDNWPEEVAWRILDASGATVVASATPFAYGAYASNPDGSSTSEKFCLDPGSYTLQIFDGYGDGGTTYNVSADGIALFSVANNAYGASTSVDFTI